MTTVPFTFTDDLATQLAAAVSQVPGVDHLDGGRYGETSTYTPKGIVKGIAYDADTHRVHVAIAVRWPNNPMKVAQAVRRALHRAVPVPIDVYINDLVVPAAESHT